MAMIKEVEVGKKEKGIKMDNVIDNYSIKNTKKVNPSKRNSPKRNRL